jgi:hypothetical protein
MGCNAAASVVLPASDVVPCTISQKKGMGGFVGEMEAILSNLAATESKIA